MSAGRPCKSHAAAWAIATLAVPVVYMLTLPPLAIVLCQSPSGNPPRWFHAHYRTPERWICGLVPSLVRPMSAYGRWWMDHDEWLRRIRGW